MGVGVRGGCSLRGLLCMGVSVEESRYVEVAVLGSCTETPHSAAHILHNLHNLQPPHPQHLAAPTHRDPTFLKPHISKPPHTTTATHCNPCTQKKTHTPQPLHTTTPTQYEPHTPLLLCTSVGRSVLLGSVAVYVELTTCGNRPCFLESDFLFFLTICYL